MSESHKPDEDEQALTPYRTDNRMRSEPTNRAPSSSQNTIIDPSAPHVEIIGARIGNYFVQSELGHGGFGTVYKARDEKLGREVAIKFVTNSMDAVHRRLFEREAKAVAALSKHPSIIQIFAWGEYEGRAYFVLEYIESSVDKLLRSHPKGVSVHLALRVCGEVAEALAHAHINGIVHRDIKPENILIEAKNERAKVTDFGIARMFDSQSADTTLSGRVSGSPRYMSPEQARAEELDGRTDVFSLGVTLYALLCGQLPYEGASASEVMDRIRGNEGVSLRTRRPEMDARVLAIVEKAMAHDRRERYQSADDMASAIRSLLEEIQGDTRAQSSKKHPRTSRTLIGLKSFAAVVAVVLIALASGAILSLLKTGGGPSVALAAADQRLDLGDAVGAAELYGQYLAGHPSDDRARYGLGYALLSKGEHAAAENEFKKIRSEPMKIEGHAVAQYEVEGVNARDVLESVKDTAATAYPKVLLANLDNAAKRYDDSVKSLERAARDSFEFGWQYDESLQALGMAYYHLGEFEKAAGEFEKLRKSPASSHTEIASIFLERSNRMADETYRASVQQQIEKIRGILADQNSDGPGKVAANILDNWTSRPLTFVMMPTDPGQSPIAAETGLAEWLPSFVTQTMTKNLPLESLNRSELDDALYEQMLSGQLSSDEEKLRLGKVLGARLLIEFEILKVMRDDFWQAELIDTETTRSFRPEMIGLTRAFEPQGLADQIQSRIWDTIRDEYPLRGRLYMSANGPVINIGTAVGVRPGMRFVCLKDPDPGHPDEGKSATVTGVVAVESAPVALEGLTAADLPSSSEIGLFILHEDWHKNYLARQS